VIGQAVIDTGPLFSALVVSHVRRRPTQVNDGLLGLADESVRHPDGQIRFLHLLASISNKSTTSHVLGEINGLVKTRSDLRGPDLSRFWNGCIDLLTLWNLNEELVRFLDFAGESAQAITRVGLVDTGLIRLAQKHGCLLITEDARTLAPLAQEQGVDCRLLKSLL
jgi:hypothetical protein